MLIISDTSVLIDMVEGDLIDTMFQLDIQFSVPDTLYTEELELHHSDLIEKGLQTLSLNPAGIIEAHTVVAGLTGSRAPGINDLLALILAKQHECPLLSGDKRLRSLAERDFSTVEVKGTIWLVEELIGEKLLTIDQAEQAFQSMNDAGSRLPKAEISRMLRRNKQDYGE